MQLEAATGKPIDELLFGERQAASSSADSRPKDPHVLRRLEKKASDADGRELSAEERTKVGELQRQIALLKQPTPGPTPVQTPGSMQTPSSELSGASTQIHAAACFASAYSSARPRCSRYLSRRRRAYHTSAEVQQQLADVRRGRECAREAARQEARKVEQATWHLLRAACALGQLGRPGTLQALWQLAMCEFALEDIADVASSPKQLQLEFRAACEEHMDALMDAFHDSELLHDEVLHQLGGAVITAVDEYDVPVANIDYCCSNSRLKLPRDKGDCGGKGG
eukprot:jgi/Chrpa1/22599/Chrysochromulina_OHIO_Genome00023905-RA